MKRSGFFLFLGFYGDVERAVRKMVFWGNGTAMTKGDAAWHPLQERMRMQKGVQGKEIWRRQLGRERCLLLYVDESGEQKMCFTDGPGVYLTEELVERVTAAGMECWLREEMVRK